MAEDKQIDRKMLDKQSGGSYTDPIPPINLEL